MAESIGLTTVVFDKRLTFFTKKIVGVAGIVRKSFVPVELQDKLLEVIETRADVLALR